MFCVNFKILFSMKLHKPRQWMHDTRWFLLSGFLRGCHLSPQNFFCFHEGAYKTFCSLDMANTGAHSMMLHKMLTAHAAAGSCSI
jgi:hypothetical protein